MPTRPKRRYVFTCKQVGGFSNVRARVEAERAHTTIFPVGRVNILEVLPLILEHACILEARAVFQSCNIASKHAGSASMQTAHEYILVVTRIVVWHNRSFISSVLL